MILLVLYADYIASMTKRIMNVEHLVEWELVWETELHEENPPQCHFVHHKSHMS
jgi:hypothetical protein